MNQYQPIYRKSKTSLPSSHRYQHSHTITIQTKNSDLENLNNNPIDSSTFRIPSTESLEKKLAMLKRSTVNKTECNKEPQNDNIKLTQLERDREFLILKNIELENEINKLDNIFTNTMTSLKNRAYLNLKIKEWDDNVIYPQAFVIIDLNNIKDINDSHGHEEGDTIIKKAASTLIVNQEPNTDIIRTDGNEFLVYMVGYSEKDVISYTRKIYKELKELPYGYGAAIGYSMIMDDIKTVDDAINEATIDMRNKKENNNG